MVVVVMAIPVLQALFKIEKYILCHHSIMFLISLKVTSQEASY